MRFRGSGAAGGLCAGIRQTLLAAASTSLLFVPRQRTPTHRVLAWEEPFPAGSTEVLYSWGGRRGYMQRPPSWLLGAVRTTDSSPALGQGVITSFLSTHPSPNPFTVNACLSIENGVVCPSCLSLPTSGRWRGS